MVGSLRLGPRMMAKYAMRHHQSPSPNGGGGKPSSNVRSPFDAAKKNTISHSQNFQNNQGGGANMENKPSLLMQTFQFTVEVTLSILISVCASAIFYASELPQLPKDASEIPLVQVWERQKDGFFMNAIRDVVVNCRKRDLYERQIREESGMGAEEE
eukprot:5534114-Ditylum_brightwellii.AAC.1